MFARFTVLIVEEDSSIRTLHQMTLKMAGYDVHTATDAASCYEVLRTAEPDLVIIGGIAETPTDASPRLRSMPANAYDLARQVRANPQTRFVPIMMRIASDFPHFTQRAADAGALAFMHDPTNLDLMLTMTRTLLDFKNYLDACESAAFTDALTGLANRRRFEATLEREAERSRRTNRAFSLITLDIDFFKKVNDTYGHDAGDEALKHTAEVLRREIRGIDVAARAGGEEFAVILPETELGGAIEVAERLREALKSTQIPTIGRITASFGVAAFPASATSVHALVNAADLALYEAKKQGRDQVVAHCSPRAACAAMAVLPPALRVVA